MKPLVSLKAISTLVVSSALCLIWQALQTKLESYPADHLTDAEQAQLAQLVQSVKDKISAIEKAEELSGDIDEIAKLLEGKTTANITSESNADLIAARNAITELKKNTALTDADIAETVDIADEAFTVVKKRH